MRKPVVFSALAAAAILAVLADRLPDSKTVENVTFARRGSLGADSYVVTNVEMTASGYVMWTPSERKFRDRALNMITLSGSASWAVPGKRAVAEYARMFVVHANVTSETPCTLSLTGADALYNASGSEGLTLDPGHHCLQFFEIGDKQYLVDSRKIERME